MQLVLSIGDRVLDRVELKADLASNDDYLYSMRRLLITKKELAIIALQQEPVFYIEAVSGFGRKKA